MFERYTEGARRTLFFARFEASQLGGATIDAEHLLLGLMRDGKDALSDIFARAGLFYTDARAEIEAHVGVRQKVTTPAEIPFGSAVHRILRYTMERADALKDREINREHLLRGIPKDDTSSPRKCCSCGASRPIATVEQIRSLVVELDRRRFDGAMVRASIDQIHLLLDALKRQIGEL